RPAPRRDCAGMQPAAECAAYDTDPARRHDRPAEIGRALLRRDLGGLPRLERSRERAQRYLPQAAAGLQVDGDERAERRRRARQSRWALANPAQHVLGRHPDACDPVYVPIHFVLVYTTY